MQKVGAPVWRRKRIGESLKEERARKSKQGKDSEEREKTGKVKEVVEEGSYRCTFQRWKIQKHENEWWT